MATDRCRAPFQALEPVTCLPGVLVRDELDLGDEVTHRVVMVAEDSAPRLISRCGEPAQGRESLIDGGPEFIDDGCPGQISLTGALAGSLDLTRGPGQEADLVSAEEQTRLDQLEQDELEQSLFELQYVGQVLHVSSTVPSAGGRRR